MRYMCANIHVCLMCVCVKISCVCFHRTTFCVRCAFRLFQNVLCSVCAVCAHELEISNRIHVTYICHYSHVSYAHVGEDVMAT